MCHSRAVLLGGDPALRGAALSALARLMAVDAPFCEANLPLLFTLLHNRWVQDAHTLTHTHTHTSALACRAVLTCLHLALSPACPRRLPAQVGRGWAAVWAGGGAG